MLAAAESQGLARAGGEDLGHQAGAGGSAAGLATTGGRGAACRGADPAPELVGLWGGVGTGGLLQEKGQ